MYEWLPSLSFRLLGHSNQYHWPEFRRRDTLDWLELILGFAQDTHATEAGFESISRGQALREAEAQPAIQLVASYLGNVADPLAGTPLLERIFSDRLMVRREFASDPLTELGAATAVDIARFDPPENFIRTAYRAGERRQLEGDFEFLRGRKVEPLIVRDPYLFHSEDARRSFEVLLALWKGVLGDMPAAVQLHFAEEANLQKRQICEAVVRGFRSSLSNAPWKWALGNSRTICG